MENKNVGLIIIGISALMALIVLIFNRSLKSIVEGSCIHGPECAMYGTISTQTDISLSITGIILIIGLVIMFSKPKEKIILKEVEKEVPRKEIDTSKLEHDEKRLVELLQKEGNAIFQAELMERLNIGKVGITRLLDKLESKQIIERKRRGMNNIVVLKN